MAFFNWSVTAGTNASADPTINFAEGMPPSAVNDSARALMARAREFGNDISGIVTAGSSTAYTVGTGQVYDTLAHLNGQIIAFIPHTTNGATVTLNIDGLGAKPLRYGPSLELQSGMLIQGTPYIAYYNNSDAAFYLRGFNFNPYGIPLGGMMPYIGSTAPNTAFAIPIGQAISRTTYATLFSLVSTTYGIGDGTTTFNVPDLRGRVPFQPDSGGSTHITVAGGNSDGTVLGGTGGAQNHTLTNTEIPLHTHSITDPGHHHAYGNPADSNGGTSITSGRSGSDVNTQNATTGITVNSAGGATPPGGGAHTIMPPYILLPYILRII